jgi:predicted dehydrogenase
MNTRSDGRVGVAILGAAHLTHAWAYARVLTTSDDADLVGIHDVEREHSRWVCQDFGISHVDDAETLVSDPAVDAVVVCSANADHRVHVELAARHGKHVLCEKPIATTLEDAYAAISACDAAGVLLQVAFVSRFLPLVARARSAVRDGRLGELVGLVGGNRGRPPLPPTYPTWITNPSQAGGGALIDHCVHVTDAMRHIGGLEVTEVSAEAGSLLWDCGVDDVAVVALRFDNGAVGSVDPSWSVPPDHPWDYDFYLRLVGTEASLDLSDTAEALRLVRFGADAPRGLRFASFAADADGAMIRAFLASVRAGSTLDPCATGADGVRALEVALAGYRSSSTGQVVRLG